MIGVVTTREGAPLNTGEIAGREIAGHNMYQNGQAFLTAGGYKGLQEQVILAGRYFINPMFATVEVVEITKVPIANAGVAIAYVGEEGKDVTGDAQAKVLNAEANVFSVVGKAKAENTLAVGTAEAEVIQKKATAVGQSNYALIEVGRALAEARIPLVPQIMVGGGGNEGGNSLANVLLANLVAKNLDGQPVRAGAPNAPVVPERK